MGYLFVYLKKKFWVWREDSIGLVWYIFIFIMFCIIFMLMEILVVYL